jgi:hypothetical protein
MVGENKTTEASGYMGLYKGVVASIFTVISLVILPSIPFIIEIKHSSGYLVYVVGAGLACAFTLGLLCSWQLSVTKRLLNHP